MTHDAPYDMLYDLASLPDCDIPMWDYCLENNIIIICSEVHLAWLPIVNMRIGISHSHGANTRVSSSSNNSYSRIGPVGVNGWRSVSNDRSSVVWR